MNLIKLRTTKSTSTFLKDLAKNSTLENFTIVVTDEQTKGRGQVDGYWKSEPFKNLTFSVFVRFKSLQIQHQKYLNFAISLAVFEVLNELNIPKLSIKWPNDILSENKKLCGVLIENQLEKTRIKSSIIGIGLNVNQEEFSKELENVTSLKNVLKKEIHLKGLLQKISKKIEEQISLLENDNYSLLEENYIDRLYKYKKPSMFKSTVDGLFMGKIVGISSDGKLQIALENETIKEFGVKEVSFVK